MSKAYQAIFASIEASGDAPPDEVLLFQAGWIDVEGEGRVLVDAGAFAAVSSQLARRGNDVVIDYEHQTLSGQKAPAAGWISSIRWDDLRGIVAAVRWTAEAAEYITTGQYRYFSPVFLVRKSDRRLCGLHSVALTNTPKTNNLRPILAKIQPEEMETMELLKKLIAALGRPDDATEEDVLRAVADMVSAKSAPPVVATEILGALGMESGDISSVVASIHAIKQAPAGMVSREEFAQIQAKLAQRDADDAVKAALSAGKITPDQVPWATEYAARDLAGFGVFVAKAPVVVPVDKLPGGAAPPHKADADPAVTAVAKLMGITIEDFEKYVKPQCRE